MGEYGWDASERKAKAATSTGMFLRFEDGDRVVGAFCGDPFAREVVWTGERYEEYDPDAHTKNPTVRISMNVFDVEAGAMRIWEMSSTAFKDVVKMRAKYGLDGKLYEISREGTGFDTRYTILPEGDISPEVAEAIANTPLLTLDPNDLDNLAGGNGVGSPISEGDFHDLSRAFKKLPPGQVRAILGGLGVRKIRDLKKSDLDECWKKIGYAEDVIAHREERTDADPFA